MKPLVVTVDPGNIDEERIKEAADIIKRGGLVAFPTETVYGLGANALDSRAAAGIFSAKKRPLDDPLIVHISRMADLERLTLEVPDKAKKLIDKFWPGPLTVVLKKTALVPDIVTTGLGTVAVRMPSGSVALRLIELSGTPIAAPSANLFGKPSPTSAAHVAFDLGSDVDMIIDGGETDIGIESTVVAFDGDEAVVLRPGGTTVEEIEKVIGKIKVLSFDANASECPGKYPQHYSPDAEVVLVPAGMDQAEKVRHLAEDLKKSGRRAGIMCVREHESFYKGDGIKVLGPKDDAKICASNLFRIFREFDREGYNVIIAEGINEKNLGLAVMNRIRKACGVF